MNKDTIFYTIVVVGVLIIGLVAGVVLASAPIASVKEVSLSDFSIGINQMAYTITVTGSGKAGDKPDSSIIILGVESEASTATEAVQENAEKLNGVVGALKALGISEDDLKTTHYSLYPIYSEARDTRRVTGYRVINEVRVVVKDLDKVSNILDKGVEAGANRVTGIQFLLSEDAAKELRDTAYQRALEDARTKAEKIAEELGLKITGIASVSESSYIQPYPLAQVKGLEVATPIFGGEIEITVTVQVIFNYSQGE